MFIKNKSIYTIYNSYIDKNSIDKDIKNIFICIDSYYKEFPHHEYISVDELKTYFFHLYPTIKDKEAYSQLFVRIDELEVSESLATEIVKSYIEKVYANKIVNKLIPVISSTTFKILPTIRKDLDEYESLVITKDLADGESPFVTDSLDSLLEQEVHGDGISWRLSCLNNDLGLLRRCSLGHVYARPDTGKTTFLLSEATNFAGQLKDDEVILYFNNEEKGSKVKLRTYNAVLGATRSQILGNVDKAKELYVARGGDKIKLIDEACITTDDIIRMCKQYKARIIIIDQGDKIVLVGDKSNNEQGRLKDLYGKFRQIAKDFEVDIITAGQASAEGHGKKWLEQIHMDNSKTGKPGELDYAIGIGCTFDDEDANLRYIHISKNKMNEGAHGKHLTNIDPMKARYYDT